MTESKYKKYFVTRPRDKQLEEWKEWGEVRKGNVYVDSDVVEGGFYLEGTWLYKDSETPYPDKPHTHDFDEYLGFIGTNPDDPYDLGGEIELWIEDEKHIITETTMVFMPAGVAHCPVYARRVDRPIWFLATARQTIYEKEDRE